MEVLLSRQVETTVSLQIVKDAAKEGIPLCADVEQSRFGPPNIVVRHYDYGKDVSLSELQLLQQIAKVASAKHRCKLHYTLEALRFALEMLPEKERKPDPEGEASERNAIERYLRLCAPSHDLRRDTEDILASWRYLKWPVNCNCS